MTVKSVFRTVYVLFPNFFLLYFDFFCRTAMTEHALRLSFRLQWPAEHVSFSLYSFSDFTLENPFFPICKQITGSQNAHLPQQGYVVCTAGYVFNFNTGRLSPHLSETGSIPHPPQPTARSAAVSL